MNFKKISLLIVISAIAVVIISLLVYEFPMKKRIAKEEIRQYMNVQGVLVENILEEQYKKDFKTGGYNAEVVLKDDPGLLYSYEWKKNRGVILIVFKDGSGMGNTGMKYPPLED